jgi:hypothetical protein
MPSPPLLVLTPTTTETLKIQVSPFYSQYAFGVAYAHN